MSSAFSISRTLIRTAGALLLVFAPLAIQAQTTTQVHNSAPLHPPAGARVAIVEFADMECPQCGRDNPILKKAAAVYGIPWVRHDFPLQMHLWSRQAAIYARWFDASPKGKALGDEYRDQIFANQASIYNLNVMNKFTQDFAKGHGLALPFSLDPKFSALVEADYKLGISIGIDHTPTVWIVTEHSKGAPYIEVPTDMGNLYQVIDQALVDTRAATPAAAKKPIAKK
jgi:protein-disulfide isomerase